MSSQNRPRGLESLRSALISLRSADPGSASLQRLDYTAAAMDPDGDRRAAELKALAVAPGLVREIALELANDHDPRVRAAVWARGDLWSPADIDAMLGRETNASVRRSVLEISGLDEHVYVRAAGEVTCAADARDLIRRHASVPLSVLELALSVYYRREASEVDGADSTRLWNLFTDRADVAEAVVTDPKAPFWLSLTAACVCPDIDDDVLAASFAAHLAAGAVDHSNDPGVASMLRAEDLLLALLERTDLGEATVRGLHALVGAGLDAGDDRLDVLLRDLDRTPAERGVAKLRGHGFPDQLLAAWESCTDEERTVEGALVALSSRVCTKAVFDMVMGAFPELTLGWVLENVSGPGVFMAPWLAHFPSEAMEWARNTGADDLMTFARELSREGVRFDQMLVADMLENPDAWSVEDIVAVRGLWRRDVAAASRMPAAAVLAVLPSAPCNEPVGESVAAQLSRLAVADPAERVLLVSALAEGLSSGASLEDLVAAATAAAAATGGQ